MFSLGNTIRAKLALAAVVAASAAAIPSSASAVVASGCPSGTPCEFVGGTGHNAATDAGGRTYFRVNTSPFATYTCADSRATAVTNSPATMDAAVTLQFSGCSAAGLGAVVACSASNVTLTSGGAGSALGTLTLAQNNCTVNIGSGLCVIRMTNTAGGQPIAVGATGATGAKAAQIAAAVTGNTDAVTFNATGLGCGLAGVPTSGTWTLSNDPNSGPLLYDEVASTSNGLVIS